MRRSSILLRLFIYGLLLLTFCLGLPSFHYATALMIALMLRHKDDPSALFKPIQSYDFSPKA